MLCDGPDTRGSMRGGEGDSYISCGRTGEYTSNYCECSVKFWDQVARDVRAEKENRLSKSQQAPRN
jgi:hypothetical protein